jgi:hypothetical protein
MATVPHHSVNGPLDFFTTTATYQKQFVCRNCENLGYILKAHLKTKGHLVLFLITAQHLLAPNQSRAHIQAVPMWVGEQNCMALFVK